MMVWLFQQLAIPVSYSIGSTISFGPSGAYDPESEYFIYECDEYDRNFLHFSPHVSLITSIDYDHPDSFPTQADYAAAFSQFITQSKQTIMWQHDTAIDIITTPETWLLNDHEMFDFAITGNHNKANATLIAKACEYLGIGDAVVVKQAIESFPGVGRRFEKLTDNLYSDYGHHPVEIAATLQMARELNNQVVLVYQPHQNTRQHHVRSGYTDCMELAETIYWLPTYLSREDQSLPTLTIEQLTENLTNQQAVVASELDDALWRHITEARSAGKLVLCMGAGSLDSWVRQQLTNI